MNNKYTVVTMRTFYIFVQDMLCCTLLLMLSADRKQSFFLLYHDNISILIYQFQHRILEFTIVFGFAHLNFHAGFQFKIILCSNYIVYQYNPVSQHCFYFATTDSCHFLHQKIHQFSRFINIIYSILCNSPCNGLA